MPGTFLGRLSPNPPLRNEDKKTKHILRKITYK